MITGNHALLIVDDDGELRDAYRDALASEQISVACVEDGQDALDLLRGGYRPCLILLDVAMPFLDGMTFRRLQLEAPDLADIPVGMISGQASGEREARRLGISAYLMKPVDPFRLFELIERRCLHAAAPSLPSTG